MKTAFGHLRAVALLGCACWVLSFNTEADDTRETGKDKIQMKELRKKAAHRKRRIIFNNDGNEPVYLCAVATADELLSKRTTPLLGSQVDTIFYCTWSSGFGMFTHQSDVAEVFTADTGIFAKNLTKEFIAQGTDPLKIMVDFCKKNNIEIFWSMRMNDTHDVARDQYPEMFPRFKQEHPEFLVGSKENPTKFGRWTSVNYAFPEVRERAFRVIEDVCKRYDIDGIEMDFFRHPTFFKSSATGGEASQEELDMMTELVRRVRKMTEDVAVERGRPLLVAMRIPDSVGYCKAIGLDVERWLNEDLVDMMAVSGYFRLNPWEESVKLGHNSGVMVYPCLSESRMKGEAQKLRMSLQSYRARAMNVWNSGADGVYLFNSFNPNNPLWRELGDPDALATMDKTYFPSYRGADGVNRFLANGERFLNLPVFSPQRPAKLVPGQTETIELVVGDDMSKARAKGFTPDLKVRLLAENLSGPADLAVKGNGNPLPVGVADKGWLEYPLTPNILIQGSNHIEVTLQPAVKAPAVLRDLGLWVRYKKNAPPE